MPGAKDETGRLGETGEGFTMSMKLNNKEGGQAMWKEIIEDILEIGSALIGAGAIFLFLCMGSILG